MVCAQWPHISHPADPSLDDEFSLQVHKHGLGIEGIDRMSEWQTIETAPCQRIILLWAVTSTDPPNWKMATGWWLPPYGPSVSNKLGWEETGCWVWEGRRLEPYDVQPTHWMSLPEPPK